MKESTILKSVLKTLEAGQMTKRVVWYQRLQSMQLGRIRVGTPGNPDVVAVVRRSDGSLFLLFIECKRPGVTKLRFEQECFRDKYTGEGMRYVVINEVKQLNKVIREVRNNE